MSSTDPRGITLSPGLVATSSDEVERVLSALMARREPLAALLAGGADSRWKLRSVDPMRQYIVVEPLSGGSAIPALLERQQVTFVAEFGGMYIEFPASGPALVTEEGARAVRMGFPRVTVSRQQRAYPRAPVPLDLPVHCAIPAGAGVALEGHADQGLANRAPGKRQRERGPRSAALPALGARRRRSRAALGLPVRQSLQ
jgi:hypothetical protein